ncbi:type III secretion system gatekeeper subunit SctW [Comamonas endophytica]|uniref:Type III secretion system gatekeeper subunit SctW n=1 Tax=Comamonas endophytica TaxID=2949090 RepID=A0ABY6GD07_9BURK|nr:MULTISPECIES: type III secretion system gatekeeper subunit SctW [unclassified Acidovorax]MCD2512849.1 type III secretion system gatekeeper subunit SctW [Acidovorax sp. D4N7]UYG52803.1 type III secretion system gatekeeper subunit SctW [Acidovorax sp. 5MLIR]
MSRIEPFNTASVDGTGVQSRAGQGSQSSVGQFSGQRIQVDGVDTMLSDAAEEISMHHAEKAESKHSSERRKEAGRPLEIMGAEAIMEYLDAAQAFEDPEQLVHLAERMLSGQGDPAQHARRASDEPTGQFMALQYALQQGMREGVAGDVLEALRESLQDLEMAHGPAIRADINSVRTAAEAGASREEIAQFQETYRDVVLGESSLAATLKLALERFGDQDYAQGLRQLTQALGQDLAAAHPSRDPVRLQHLLQDLYRLEVTATVLDGCSKLQDRLAHRYGTASSVSPAMLMRSLVDISAEAWISGQRFTDLSENCGAAQVPEAQIQFLTTVRGLMREMPVQVFVDPEQRQLVLDAAQDALDAAIDGEVA